MEWDKYVPCMVEHWCIQRKNFVDLAKPTKVNMVYGKQRVWNGIFDVRSEYSHAQIIILVIFISSTDS